MFINKFSNLLKSNGGKFLISIILGLGLASLFRKVCDDDYYNCVVYNGSDYEKEIKDKKFKHDGKCYKYDIEAVSCDDKKKIVNFA